MFSNVCTEPNIRLPDIFYLPCRIPLAAITIAVAVVLLSGMKPRRRSGSLLLLFFTERRYAYEHWYFNRLVFADNHLYFIRDTVWFKYPNEKRSP
jgi:hypothetical protein